jgi:hypothetical protein
MRWGRPVAETVREKILQYLENGLKDITKANGDAFDMGEVHRGRMELLNLNRYPACSIIFGDDTTGGDDLMAGDNGLYERDWEGGILGWAKTQADLNKATEALLGAVQRMIGVDNTCGGNAIDIGEAGVGVLREAGKENEGGFFLHLKIRYRTIRGDPFTKA